MVAMGSQTHEGERATHPARSAGRPGVVVALLTVASLGVVGLLALSAARSARTPVVTDQAKPAGLPVAHAPASTPASVAAVPANSGTGQRVVYSLSQRQVWAIAPDGSVARKFGVVAGAATPAPGTYQVYSRSEAGRGGDGRAVRYVLRFAHSQPGNVVVGFDTTGEADLTGGPNAATGSTTVGAGKAAPPLGGAIRETAQDAAFLWGFAPLGSTVVVAP